MLLSLAYVLFFPVCVAICLALALFRRSGRLNTVMCRSLLEVELYVCVGLILASLGMWIYAVFVEGDVRIVGVVTTRGAVDVGVIWGVVNGGASYFLLKVQPEIVSSQ